MVVEILLASAVAASLPAPPAQLQTQFSSADNDYNPSLDESERLIVFARSKAGFKDAHIYVSHRLATGWEPPQPIAFTDARYSDSDPWLTPDGRTLYFISNRPTAAEPAKKDLDIWHSHRTVRGWSAPEHIDGVSGPGPELGPELHDGLLTFASVRPGGKGGLDIYAARSRKQGFEAPQPLPGPFNSALDESDFTVSRDGKMAAFWRGNKDGRSLYLSYRTGTGWSEPRKLSENANPGPFNSTPAFGRDGRTLWFASDKRRDGQEAGNADIFIVSVPRAPK
jgi:Tol biopolymer transport system component